MIEVMFRRHDHVRSVDLEVVLTKDDVKGVEVLEGQRARSYPLHRRHFEALRGWCGTWPA